MQSRASSTMWQNSDEVEERYYERNLHVGWNMQYLTSARHIPICLADVKCGMAFPAYMKIMFVVSFLGYLLRFDLP